MSADTLLDAVRDDRPEVVRELLAEDGGLLEELADAGTSVILEAIFHGAEDSLGVLLERGRGLDVFEAAAVGEAERVRELLDEDPDRATAFGPDGWTSLHLACFFGHPRAARVLLERGAPVGAVSRNATANQPLHAALAGAGEPGIVEMLLDHGADPGAAARGGTTPLHLAASRGDVPLARLLLERGADPDAVSDDGSTPAEIAEERGHTDAAKRLSR